MKILSPVNQHIPVWSILCGDHALREEVKKINPELLTKPDFGSALENRLRYDVFTHKRGWIEEKMGRGFASFHVAQFTMEDLMDDSLFQTCFTGVTFKRFAEEFWKGGLTNKGFTIERKGGKEPIEKTPEDSKKIWEMGNQMLGNQPGCDLADVTNPKFLNEGNLWVAANRGMVVKQRDGKTYIYDGTHRITAYAVGKLRQLKGLPDSLLGFWWEEV